MTHKILAVGPHAWGKGATIKEAVDNLWPHLSYSIKSPRTGPKLGVSVIELWLVPETAYVNAWGSITWTEGEGPSPVCLGHLDRARKPAAAPEG